MTNQYLETKKIEAAEMVEKLITMLVNDFEMTRETAITHVKSSTLKDYNHQRMQCNGIPQTMTDDLICAKFESRDMARLMKEYAESL